MKKYTFLILFVLLTSILVAGCTESESDKKSSQASVSQPVKNTDKDAEWVKNVTKNTEVLTNDSKDISDAMNNSDWYTTFANIDTYKLDLNNAITSSDSFTVSPELQSCKDEYRLGLIDDYNAAILMKTAVNLLTEGDFASSTETLDLMADNCRSANLHYENVTSLLDSYNEDHESEPLYISTLYHYGITQEDDQSTVNTPTQTTKSEGYTREETADNTETSESAASTDSSTNDIFEYCTWQAETTKNIGEYYKAPENQTYVIVTLKINNTGDQTYSTNGNYWHLKIGDMYYQYDTATYDSSLNHMTTDIGPGGKITTKIAYLVDGEVSISDLGLYYDGPGSDGVIYS